MLPGSATDLGVAGSAARGDTPTVVVKFPRRINLVVVVLMLALLVCGAAYADNYSYKRTRAGDAAAASMTVRRTDFPAQFRLTGGRVKPDETPNLDSCNGYRPKERDLLVAGDAESRFHDGTRDVVVDSQVELFQSTAMAAADVRRGKRMLAPACQAQAARQEHVKLVSYSLLGRPHCSCDFAVSAMFETKTSHPNLDMLSIITGIRKGRFEATVFTSVGKSTSDSQNGQAALRAALIVQGMAVKAVLSRLHAT
jgi:hypothetical protein